MNKKIFIGIIAITLFLISLSSAQAWCPADVIHVWSFNDSDTLTDYTTYNGEDGLYALNKTSESYTVTNTGATGHVTATAWDFSQPNDVVQLGDVNWNSTGDFSFFCWTYAESLNAQHLLRGGDTRIQTFNANTHYFWMGSYAGDVNYNSGQHLRVGYHYTGFTFDGATGTVYGYNNGTQLGSTDGTDNGKIERTTFYIGGIGAGEGWDGLIDECMSWNVTLSADDVMGLYNNKSSWGNGLDNATEEGCGPAEAPPSANLTIIANDSRTNLSLTLFNVTLGGVEYNVTSSPFTTYLQPNSSQLWNITVNSKGYETLSLQNYNVSVNISANLNPFWGINANNTWNNSLLDIINITVNGTLYQTTSDGIMTNIAFNDTRNFNITFQALDYRTLNIDTLSPIINYTVQAYQSFLSIWATEISTITLLTRWTLNATGGRGYNTTNGSVTLYPNLGTYSWNWSTNMSNWYNISNIEFTIDEEVENLSIVNIYARNISFWNALSINTRITPNCTQGAYSYASYSYYMPYITSNLTCILTGFQDTEFAPNSTPDSTQYRMVPAMLHIVFTDNTTGEIETEDCEALPQNCATFNSSSVYIQQTNISVGYVTVKFNPDGADWQQIFQYYNDGDTHIKEYIQLITPDLVQDIKVTGGGTPLDLARVVSLQVGTNPETSVQDWLTTYADYTDINGEAKILVNDEDTYKFCASADGYTTRCEILYIPPANTDTFIIDLTPTSTSAGNNFVGSSCPNLVTEAMNCTLEVNTFQPYSSICINFSSTGLNDSVCGSNSITQIFNYVLNSSIGNTTITVFLDAIEYQTIFQEWVTYNPNTQITWGNATHQDGTSLIDKIKEDREYLIVAQLILFIISILLGLMAETYFNGYGIYGTAIYLGLMAYSGFYVFWIPVIIVGFHFVLTKIVPLVKNY